jgi:Protein of unknown function (DUF2934)
MIDRDVANAALRQKIEERAYHIWLENGRGHGDHERHWLQAERELTKATNKGRRQSDFPASTRFARYTKV